MNFWGLEKLFIMFSIHFYNSRNIQMSIWSSVTAVVEFGMVLPHFVGEPARDVRGLNLQQRARRARSNTAVRCQARSFVLCKASGHASAVPCRQTSSLTLADPFDRKFSGRRPVLQARQPRTLLRYLSVYSAWCTRAGIAEQLTLEAPELRFPASCLSITGTGMPWGLPEGPRST